MTSVLRPNEVVTSRWIDSLSAILRLCLWPQSLQHPPVPNSFTLKMETNVPPTHKNELTSQQTVRTKTPVARTTTTIRACKRTSFHSFRFVCLYILHIVLCPCILALIANLTMKDQNLTHSGIQPSLLHVMFSILWDFGKQSDFQKQNPCITSHL